MHVECRKGSVCLCKAIYPTALLDPDSHPAHLVTAGCPAAAMGTELPAVSAVAACLPLPEINLAAYGGVVFPLALIIESLIIMLLAASTALSKDRASYLEARRYMMAVGAVFTALHLLVAFTSACSAIVQGVLGAPEQFSAVFFVRSFVVISHLFVPHHPRHIV